MRHAFKTSNQIYFFWIMLEAYTLHVVHDDVVEIDFVSPIVDEDELRRFVSFFKRKKHLMTIGRVEGEEHLHSISSITTPVIIWIGFLVKLGFRDNARAVLSVFNEFKAMETDEYVETSLGRGKPLREPFVQPKSNGKIKPKWRRHLENMEIRRRLENNEFLEKGEKKW